ncbi:bacteriocin [uncultured Flavobacterium sp.]
MKNLKNKSLEKASRLKNLKPLSKNQLETIVGGPETSRGTEVKVGT